MLAGPFPDGAWIGVAIFGVASGLLRVPFFEELG